MAFYKVGHDYISAAWPEPLTSGRIIDITVEQAATLNGDSPGVVAPIELVEKVEVVEERTVEAPPLTMARRGPGRKRAVESESED